MTHLSPLGDHAVWTSFPSEELATLWADSVRSEGLEWVVDVVVAYGRVAIHADPRREFSERMVERLASIPALERRETLSRRHLIPVVYDGLDLAEVAERLNLTENQVIDAHSSRDYRVEAIGFLPGFPYAGELPDALRGLPRRLSPRARVPAGSVAIAGRQTAIYPQASPGGWHLLGRTPSLIVDLPSGHFPIRVGDLLRFQPIAPSAFDSLHGLLK